MQVGLRHSFFEIGCGVSLVAKRTKSKAKRKVFGTIEISRFGSIERLQSENSRYEIVRRTYRRRAEENRSGESFSARSITFAVPS